jgi:hypothetical protein
MSLRAALMNNATLYFHSTSPGADKELTAAPGVWAAPHRTAQPGRSSQGLDIERR